MEKETLERAKRGDPEAFYQLLEPLERKLYHYALGMARTREDAEDALQEAYCKAFQHLRELKNPRAFPTYLFRIVRNSLYDLAKREKGMPLLEESPDPSTLLERQEEQKDLRRALEKLPLSLREPLLLYALEGLHYEEIAGILALPVGTVKSRLSRAKRQLLKVWQEREEKLG